MAAGRHAGWSNNLRVHTLRLQAGSKECLGMLLCGAGVWLLKPQIPPPVTQHTVLSTGIKYLNA